MLFNISVLIIHVYGIQTSVQSIRVIAYHCYCIDAFWVDFKHHRTYVTLPDVFNFI